jgi:hypothetical protein
LHEEWPGGGDEVEVGGEVHQTPRRSA